MRPRMLAVLVGAVVACGGLRLAEDTDDPDSGHVDADRDGSPASLDCDDGDPDRAPGKAEVCDGVDNDCNDVIDDEPVDGEHFWSDADRDGFGADGEGSLSCQQPPDTADRDGDCDDTDPDINPDADEVCDEDNTDEDCDGRADDADDSTLRESMRTWHVDRDRDGFGDPERTLLACDEAPGRTADDTDCDDEDAALNPALGCPGPWDGDWDTTLVLEVTLTDAGYTESCRSTKVLDVDMLTRPDVVTAAPFVCTLRIGEASIGLEANFTSEDVMVGTLDFEGTTFPIEARFTAEPELAGKGTASPTVKGFRTSIRWSLLGRPVR